MGCPYVTLCVGEYEEIENKLLKKRPKVEITPSWDSRLKLLLLGTAESGKSTFAKQMTILHKQGGFTEDELREYIPILHQNTLDSMKILITACRNQNIELGDTIQSLEDEIMVATQLTEDIAKCAAIGVSLQKLLWGASVQYYLENAVRFAREDFIPTHYDILRAKQNTKGVLETSFEVTGTNFVMVDVSGKRSDRKIWLSCFTDVAAVIYLASLNDYDMLLEEDDKTNRLEESIKLFQNISGSQWLKDTPFILFLNKCDLFEKKIKTRPLMDYFEDYEDFAKDNNGYETSCEYIKSQFSKAFKGYRLYTFIINALDTSNCERIFLAVRDVVKVVSPSM